jgi:hypothetical protein
MSSNSSREGGSFNGSFYGSSVGMVARSGGNGRLFVHDLGRRLDLTKAEIWVRVAEVFAGQSTTGPPTGFQLGVRDGNGTESWVDSDDVGGLPRPFPRRVHTMKTMLKTLRFKAACFTVDRQLDISSITTIMVRCNRSDDLALAFDDLQIVAG